MNTSNTYLRRSVAEASKIYQAIRSAANERLTREGSFRKDDVIKDCELEAVSEAIRWDYIRDMLQRDNGGVELIPMAESYFAYRVKINGVMERNTTKLQETVPHRFIAMGHGKKTSGYALVMPSNGHLVLVIAKLKNARASGVRKSADKFSADATQRNSMGRITPPSPKSISP